MELLNRLAIFSIALYFYGSTKWEEISPGIAPQTPFFEGSGSCTKFGQIKLLFRVLESIRVLLTTDN